MQLFWQRLKPATQTESFLENATPSHTNHTSEVSKLMRDRVVLITGATGASRGIGAATAKFLGQHGAAVGVNYYGSEEAAQQVVEGILSDGGRAVAVLQCEAFHPLITMTMTSDLNPYDLASLH